MAFPATMVAEIRTGGSDNNSGMFNAALGGTDRTLQDAAHATLTTASTVNVITTSVDVHASDYTCSDSDIGNTLRITGGSATAGLFHILGRTAQRWNLDRTAGTSGQTVVGSMGGALASPGGLGRDLVTQGVNDMKGWVKSATYTLSTATVNIPSGALDLAAAIPGKAFLFRGYATTRGDFGRPTIGCGAITPANGVIIKCDGNYHDCQVIENFVLDGNSKTVAGLVGDDHRVVLAHNVTVQDCDGSYGFYKVGATYCKAISCGVGADGFDLCDTLECWADSNAGNGFEAATEAFCAKCLASGNTFGFDINYANLIYCVSYKNSSHGFNRPYFVPQLSDCVSVLDGGYSFNVNEHTALRSCGSYNATSGRTPAGTPPRVDMNPIVLSANPFIDGDAGDFRLNASGITELGAAGIGVYGQTDTPDVNAISAIRGAGGGGCIISAPLGRFGVQES